jgi:alpha-amylase/alpha-mannosidase (GH57 family)
MPPAITLLLGVHAHQPVGNFPEVIEDAHQRCYKPFLHTLHAYPDFRFAAHFSGWLLDWLRERHPADMALLAEMVRRGQVELFSSGDTEPVLAAIPHRDRIGQLQTLNDKLAAWTGVQPSGAWLTERVWESAVVPALAATGIRYVTVDDYHFFCTGQPRRWMAISAPRKTARGSISSHLGSPALPPALLAGARSDRLPRRPGRAGPGGRHLLRRHREIRHLAGNLRLGLTTAAG